MGKAAAFGNEAEQFLARLKLSGVEQFLDNDENGGASGISFFRQV
jgi:hypothetical protein